MILLWPWMLLCLPIVLGAALWALFRPGRQLAVVGSLDLWKQALARLDRSILSRTRKLSPAWWCLLVGAIVAGLAMARPVWRSHPPARQISIAIIPSAELGQRKALETAVSELLDRLSANDQVRLLLPTVLPASGDWLTPAQVREKLATLPILPVTAGEVDVGPAGAAVQHTYLIGPAGMSAPSGRNVTFVGVQPSLPEATVDAIGARQLPGGQVQIFVAVRNQTDGPVNQVLGIGRHVEAGRFEELRRLDVKLAPGQRQQFVAEVPAFDAYEAALAPAGGPGTKAWLARQTQRQVKVAMVGVDEPLVRRLVEVHSGLKLVGEKDAEIFIANQASPPPGRPALVINPKQLPPGWSRGDMLQDVPLRDAKVADYPVMKNVSLAGEVRRLQPWTAAEDAQGKVLARVEQGAIILADEAPATTSGPAAKRIYVAFDVGASNCTWGLRTSFVVFLASAIDYLAPWGTPSPSYTYRTPLQAGDLKGEAYSSTPMDGPVLPSPGLYRDPAGGVQAVNLLGLRKAGQPSSTPAELGPLPEPRLVQADRELWPVLAGLAAMLWLAGWFLRSRE